MAKVTRRSSRPPSLRAGLQRRCQQARNLIQANPRFTGLLLAVLVLLAVIGLATFLPSRQPFEGSLSLQALSFVSTAPQPFLLNTPSLREVSLQGNLPLRLTGQFSGNPALQGLNALELEARSEDATWQITAAAPATISLADLPLSAQTAVRHLTYDAQNQRLAFDLIPAQSTAQPTPLSLQPNGNLTVQLSDYRIKNAPRTHTQPTIDFTWQPDNQQFFTLEKPIHLDLQFAELTASPFWGRIACEQVILDKPEVRATAYHDQYRQSAILGGTIRLADKSYALEENQFLKFQPPDSIQALLRLRLAEEKTTVKPNDNQLLKLNQQQPGLQVDVSGETQQIIIGLNEQLPVAKLQASFLEAWMPRDAVIALIAFLSTLAMTLIGWLWEIATEEPESNHPPNPPIP